MELGRFESAGKSCLEVHQLPVALTVFISFLMLFTHVTAMYQLDVSQFFCSI